MGRLAACAMCWFLIGLASGAEAQETLICAACGETISGDYVTVEGRFYHRDHLVCDHCNQPIRGPFITWQGRNLHASCYDQRLAVKCFACNRSVDDAYYEDPWGNTYHAAHLDDEAQCDFCRRLIVGTFSPGRESFPDGRELCGYCASTSVTTTSAAEALLARVVQYLNEEGLRVDVSGVNVLLLYRDKMQKLSPDPSYHLLGFADFASFADAHGRALSSGANIYLLFGMPRIQMIAVLAHELMHVWQGSRQDVLWDDVLREGGANYVSYRVMQRLGTAEASFIMEQMMKETHPVYGDGFRRVKRYMDDKKLAALLTLTSSGALVVPDDH